MRILTINCGSSSLKFDVLDAEPGERPTHIAHGSIERFGAEAACSIDSAGVHQSLAKPIDGYAEAFREAIRLLGDADLVSGMEAIGHRVVHGGTRFRQSSVVSEPVLQAIEQANSLAPLHNGPALAALHAASEQFHNALPMVACFDTAFFVDLPEVAARYALPERITSGLGIRRYGFHGLAHRYMVEAFAEARPRIQQPRLITLQLGNGCSAAASVGGVARDTSMGFTPLEGMVMGTRSGDLDPAIPLLLAAQGQLTPQEVEALLNTQSGLLGLSGSSADMRTLTTAAAAGDSSAGLAIEIFCYRAMKYTSSYLGVLNGADGIIFGGGIGEHCPEIRTRICSGLEWAGVRIEQDANEADAPATRVISTADSAIEVWVVAVDEASVIAAETVATIRGNGPDQQH